MPGPYFHRAAPKQRLIGFGVIRHGTKIDGSPVVELHGLSRELSEGRRVVVSITHTQNYAAAVAALEPVTDDGR